MQFYLFCCCLFIALLVFVEGSPTASPTPSSTGDDDSPTAEPTMSPTNLVVVIMTFSSSQVNNLIFVNLIYYIYFIFIMLI